MNNGLRWVAQQGLSDSQIFCDIILQKTILQTHASRWDYAKVTILKKEKLVTENVTMCEAFLNEEG